MSRTPAAVGFRRPRGIWSARGVAGWPLRWKMAVVLTVPLTVAAGLGFLRVQQSLTAAADFTTVSERAQILPLLVELDGHAAVVMGTLALRTISTSMIDNLDASIVDVENANTANTVDEGAASDVATALSGARALSAQAKRGPTSTEALTAQLASIRSALSSAVGAITAPIADPEVVVETVRLEGLWAAQKLVSAQGLSVVASTAILTGESGANLEAESVNLLANLRTESALLDQVAQRYPPGDPTMTTLRNGVNDRTALLPEVAHRESADRALADLKNSLIASADDYSNAIATASADLKDAVVAKSAALRTQAWRDTGVVTALLLAAILLAVVVARSLLQPLRRLRRGALRVAHADLPDAVGRLKSGADASTLEFDPIDVHTHEEIGQLARAVDDIHSQALLLAGEQAQLRLQMNNVFETLARRSRSLIDLQLEMIEQLEFEERDPKRLDNLFRLDHLATRMCRNGDNLLILAGNDNRRGRPAPILLGDAMRAAISEVEDYQRVQVGAMPPVTLTGTAGRDLVHVLAELLDNSLHFSPPDSAVTTTCARTIDGGVVIEIADRGIGMAPADLHELNDRVASTPEVTPDTARHMGLFVVSELSKRHTITITFRPTLDLARNAGITVSVHISGDVLTSEPEVVRASPGGRPQTAGKYAALTAQGSIARIPKKGVVPIQRQHPGQVPVSPEGVGASGPSVGALPQRRPGATGIATAARPRSVAPQTNSDGASGPGPRHRLGASRTASFFEPRVVADETERTPIFASIAPLWLTDPTTVDNDVPQEWVTRADTGWSAARRAAQHTPERTTLNGLPQRIPGQRLVPGGVDGTDRMSRHTRTPEAVRANLTRHQSGVRAGRMDTPRNPGPVDPWQQEEPS
ncbi:sensor histidine kinase [Rhodococcus sp. JS3073]|uniref:sensor histidine kinase n=1 Tax=Rhodococcus sp. JS3073 TaxID=3002901 RepID=UPI002285F5A5|nr:ATP-binding protein [Rhodococcus sp. JS3073]WAM19728.1 ATP-binding protein [Rhodococcus sp. JS3073]